MLQWLLFGRRRRNRQSLSMLLLVVGVLACCLTGVAVAVGIPTGIARSWQVNDLPRVPPANLPNQPAGTTLLTTVQLPPLAAAQPASTDPLSSTHGLVVFYIEETLPVEGPDDTVRIQPPAPLEVPLPNGEPLRVQFAPAVSFLNAHELTAELPAQASADSSATDAPPVRRWVGYLPEQALTIEGTWEGGDLLTARTCFAGSIDGYVDYWANAPWVMLWSGIFCGVTGALLLSVGFVLRMMGR